MTSVDPAAWEALVKRLEALKSFRLHTGNMNDYLQLKTKRYKTSAEELVACLDMQFAELQKDVTVQENGTFLLAAKDAPLAHDRDDLKITLKVFLDKYSTSEVEAAIAATLGQLKVENIEQLIIDFPPVEDDEVDQAWLDKILAVWNDLEKLVQNGKVVSIGVSDFNLKALQMLVDAAETKPCVNHYNIDGCCVVPPDLQKYAQENDIQLLTHNDPRPFPLREVFQTICTLNKTSPVCREHFIPTWAARYTVWIRRRSIMAAKGYIVQFDSTSSS